MANYCNQEACHIMFLLCWAHNRKALPLIISYYLFSFRGSVQDYKIHMDMEIVKFA